jgi:hypothetical protein
MANKPAADKVVFESEQKREEILSDCFFMGGGKAELMTLRTQWEEQDRARVEALCDQYGIPPDPDRFYRLALLLARQLHPEPKPPARKKKWTAPIKAMFVIEVDRLVRDDPAHGLSWACKQLARQERWRDFLEGDEPEENLRQNYYKFKKTSRGSINMSLHVMREQFKECQESGNLKEWEAIVDTALLL